jgi:hypothetical protein
MQDDCGYCRNEMAFYGISLYAKLRNRQLFSTSESSQLRCIRSEECTIRETLKSERNCKLLIELKWAKLAL